MTAQNTTDQQAGQYLTFELAGEAYGVEILKVREIRGWEPVRKMPNTPRFVKGALNLRGAIVPIIDLRERFNMEAAPYTPTTVVIVISVETGASGPVVMGIVADAVSDVLDIEPNALRDAPNLGSKINTRYMRGMYVGKHQMVMLLDVDKLLNPEEFVDLDSLSTGQP
ncbi:MAG: purine-binding chemotaxis protein CheW [Methylomonas sp.]|nr:purine-binding chemotaxis protein CheW [Methylomonas sp.]PPD20961.1 MAG: chemotaxis protein CheW [Methylomonas sp.]PPD27236.1 MAG: chemotaxis protein CheW [Methylomonas sp.]PPD39186.1 MAG: chemotaxis protein CheW [Methylomonas sp.]PPD41346.1 MAG: chemotaxis protein CheW [Methylomonas sp.]